VFLFCPYLELVSFGFENGCSLIFGDNCILCFPIFGTIYFLVLENGRSMVFGEGSICTTISGIMSLLSCFERLVYFGFEVIFWFLGVLFGLTLFE